jgi:hypothetical protein
MEILTDMIPSGQPMMTSNSRLLKIPIVFGLITFFLVGFYLIDLPQNMGALDFRAYWSASYLLSQSENFSDDQLLFQVQKEFVGLDEDFPMKTWNPPWVLIWVLPYAVLSFSLATKLWLLTNILLLVFGIMAAWQLVIESQSRLKSWVWLPLLAAILFPSTIVAMLFGQVNLLVFAGLAGFLFFYYRNQNVLAGLSLAFTMTKPHLVYLALPIIFLFIIRERRWLVLIVYSLTLIVSTAVVFLLRPTFMAEYLSSTIGGNLFAWEAATLTTYLSIAWGWPWVRVIGLLLAPVLMFAWLFWRHRLNMLLWVEVTVLLSVITMPFGWSYDYVVLLLPMCQIFAWLLIPIVKKPEAILISSFLLMMYVLYYYQRVVSPSELYFFWVPLIIASIYGWLFYRCQSQPAAPPIKNDG